MIFFIPALYFIILIVKGLFALLDINIFEISQTFHNNCLEMLDFKSNWKDVYNALVCGKRLPEGEIKNIFIKEGLIHLMVVSGAHLIFFEGMFQRIKISLPMILLIPLLLIYACMTQFHPPVTRALITFLLFYFSKSQKLFFPNHIVTHLSAIICLFISPKWFSSYSFQLSYLASMVQSAFPSNNLKKGLFTYILILPIVNQWTYLHPFSVFVNWFIAPIVGSLLFPLSFLTIGFRFIHKITDFLWEILYTILKHLEFLFPKFQIIPFTLEKDQIWFYILSVGFILHVHFKEQIKRFWADDDDKKK